MSYKEAASVLFASLLLCIQAAGSDQRVRLALGEGEGTDFRVRLQALQSLYEGLSPEDAEELYAGIIVPNQPQGLPLAQWAAVYNDAFNAIGKLQEPLDDYPKRLLGLVGQEKRPAILRDYALQHLLSHMQSKLTAAARENLIPKVEKVAGSATRTKLPGTYLLGIWQLAGDPGYPSAEAIGKLAFGIAADTEAFAPNRTTAIQVCGQLGYEPALDLGKTIAGDITLPVALRSASLATIGQLGDSSLIPFLRKVKHTGTPDSRIIFASDAALQELQQ